MINMEQGPAPSLEESLATTWDAKTVEYAEKRFPLHDGWFTKDGVA